MVTLYRHRALFNVSIYYFSNISALGVSTKMFTNIPVCSCLLRALKTHSAEGPAIDA
jgi:hypothetical protein